MDIDEDSTSLAKLQAEYETKTQEMSVVESEISELEDQLRDLGKTYETRTNIVTEKKKAVAARQNEIDSIVKEIAKKVTKVDWNWRML